MSTTLEVPVESSPSATDQVPVPTNAIRRLVLRLGASMIVSGVTTTWSLTILAVLTATSTTGAATGNVIATLAGIPWSYWLNRRFVWGRRHRSDVRREVLPFVAMCLVALLCSTVVVGWADHAAVAIGLERAARTVVVMLTNLGTFGGLWIVQFLLLDRVLFRMPSTPEDAPEDGTNVRAVISR